MTAHEVSDSEVINLPDLPGMRAHGLPVQRDASREICSQPKNARIMSERVDDEKIELLKIVLSELGIECARTIEERVDPQFSAIERLHENIADDDTFIKLVTANAIVSYQLSGRGEQWWWEFSEYFSQNPPQNISEAYARFLPASRTNRRLISAKLLRLKRFERFLVKKPYYEDMVRFRNDIASVLAARRDAKTIVFAVKMFGYAIRIVLGEFVPYPMEIDIPKDSRIERYTGRFSHEDPIKFWRAISEEVQIPPLHIDSILWHVLGGGEDVETRLRAACENADMILRLATL